MSLSLIILIITPSRGSVVVQPGINNDIDKLWKG